jgi:hypothetical protein
VGGNLLASSAALLPPADDTAAHHDDAKCPYYQYLMELNASMSNELMADFGAATTAS